MNNLKELFDACNARIKAAFPFTAQRLDQLQMERVGSLYGHPIAYQTLKHSVQYIPEFERMASAVIGTASTEYIQLIKAICHESMHGASYRRIDPSGKVYSGIGHTWAEGEKVCNMYDGANELLTNAFSLPLVFELIPENMRPLLEKMDVPMDYIIMTAMAEFIKEPALIIRGYFLGEVEPLTLAFKEKGFDLQEFSQELDTEVSEGNLRPFLDKLGVKFKIAA